MAASSPIGDLAALLLGRGAALVRALLFDKTPGVSWKVPWHQDVTITVARRLEFGGYGPWSMKAEIWHVQPPSEILEAMRFGDIELAVDERFRLV